MKIDGEAFSQRVEQAVEDIERSTDAEVVVVCAYRSGSYRDIGFAAASAAALVLLMIIEVLPFPIHAWAVVADLAIGWFLTAWLAGSDRILPLLVPRARLRRQVEEAAAAEFHTEAVHATPNRTGVLVYVSALERRVEVIADIGVEARVPRGRLAPALTLFTRHDEESFLSGLRLLGAVLADALPHVEGSDETDLPNAPRVRS